MSIRIEKFGGISPKVSPALLPGYMATVAKNARIDSGSIVPLKGVSQVAMVPSTSRSIYRHETSPAVWEWVYWDAANVDVVRSPVANDDWNRIYYTGDGVPKYGFTDTETLAFTKGLTLGIPRPTYPPVLSTSSAAGAPNVSTVASAIEFTAGTLTLAGNATLGADSATKSSGSTNGVWDTQGYSTQSYKNACAVRFTIPVRPYGAIAGLDGSPSTKANHKSIDFGILSNNKGVIQIYESGKLKGSFGTHADTDQFEIEYRGAKIIYKKNGDVLRESKTLIERTFFFDSSLAGQNSAIQNIEFGTYSVPAVNDVFKAGGVTLNGNASITGNRVEKVKGIVGYNQQAYTIENYTGGCVVKFQFGSTKGAAAGLNSPPLTASGYTSLDYAILGNESGNVKIFESGVDRGTFATYVAGDAFEIEYSGDTVTYRKNGIVMRTVTTTTGRTFYFDSSLRAKGSIISNIEFGTILREDIVVETFVEEASEKERYYVYTYVSPLGEEGPPSPAALIKVNDLQDVTLTFESETLTGYNLGAGSRRRVYRTAQGTTDTVYMYVGDAPIEALTMQDNLLDVSLGEIIPSTLWFPPPEDLAGLTIMPNGFVVGFSGNALCPSEQFLPHAFDPFKQLSFPTDITGIAVTGDSIIVMTRDAPYLVTGQTPAELSAVRIDHPQTCSNRASIVNMGGYVMMACPDGLLSVTANDMAVATQEFFTRDQWQAYSPSTMKGFFYEGIYIGFSDTKAFMFDMRTSESVLTELEGFSFVAGFRDHETDILYLLDSSGNIKSWETGSSLSFTWKSKPLRVPVPVCPSALRLYASGSVTFNMWVDGINVVSNMAISNSGVARLPSGYKAKEFQIQLSGSAIIDSIAIANTIEELS